MLTPQELRLGNYVKVDNNIEKVFVITEDHISIEDSLTCYVKYSGVYGIPLNEEILAKCGFEKDSWMNPGFRKNLFSCHDLHIKFNQTTEKWNTGIEYLESTSWFDKHPQYLHQLQNLYFAITGNELEIKL